MATFNLNSALNGINNSNNLTNPNPNPQNQTNLTTTNGQSSNGLPYSQVTPLATGQIKRHIISWFVPQFGVVQMYVNPQNIVYTDEKLITKERTKGGFTLQYWGEELTTLSISGTTGSSGIEGINALHEVYRAEQYAFDAVGLTLAANNAAADVAQNLMNGIGSGLGQLVNGLLPSTAQTSNATAAAIGAGTLGGILGLDSPNNTLSARNIPSLAQLAFGVEMFYNGWVFRGYFKSMNFTEKAENFLIDYNMNFVVTQRSGYRTNYFPFQRSANSGPSNSSSVPNSFSGYTSSNR